MCEKNRAREYYINNKEQGSLTKDKKQKTKKYRKNMTDEQKHKDYQKQYRKNMTDEQKKNIIKLMNKNKKTEIIKKNIEKI